MILNTISLPIESSILIESANVSISIPSSTLLKILIWVTTFPQSIENYFKFLPRKAVADIGLAYISDYLLVFSVGLKT